MNITKLYNQLQEGTVSKDYFVKVARTQFPQYISPVSSYKDIVTILKGKRLISEAHKLTTDQIIDRLSPYSVKKGIEIELEKQKDYSNDGLKKAKEKVAKKLQKNPKAYDELDKKAEKANKKVQMKDYKETEKVDKDNASKVLKKDEKANTKVSKKENKKGKPKGVKQLKESILSSIGDFIVENAYHDYHSNMEVMTPDGEGTIKEVVGGTLTVELKSGETKDYQINVVHHATEQAKEDQAAANQQPVTSDDEKKAADKAERDAMWAKWDKEQHPKYGGMIGSPETMEEKKDSIIKKLKEFFSKNKIKKEGKAIKDKAGNVTYADDITAANMVQSAAKKGIKLTSQTV
jgi:hypothetical protein